MALTLFRLWKGLGMMNRLYVFTNRRGQQNHGIVAERTAGGMYVMFDVFDIAPGVQLPARFSFVSDTPNPYTIGRDTKSEVLPLTNGVKWIDERIAKVAKIAIAGDFDAWWAENSGKVMGELYGKEVTP